MPADQTVDAVNDDPVSTLQRWLPLIVAIAAALTSLTTIAGRVLGGSRFQYADYWRIFDSTISVEDGFAERNILLLQNEHPVAFARFLYYLNYRLFDGSNVALGVIVIGVVIAQVIVLQRHNPLTGNLPRATLLFGTIALLLAPAGIHNFQYAMSGSAWLTANLFAILALHFAIRAKLVPAVIAGVIASASYGTGLMVWPALALLASSTIGINRKSVLAIGSGWVASWVTYGAMFDRPAGHGGFSLDLSGLAFRTASTIGSAFSTSASTAILFGIAIVFVLLLSSTDAAPLTKAPMSLGLAVYGVLGAGLISFSRAEFGNEVGVASRYVSISAITAIGVLGLVSVSRPKVTAPVIAAAGLLVSIAGQPGLAHFDNQALLIREAAIATRIGTGDGYFPIFQASVRPKIEELGHYPFNDDFEFDCGLLRTAPPTTPAEGIAPADNRVTLEPSPDPALVRINGSFNPDEPIPTCLVVIAGTQIVGAGVIGGSPAGVPDRLGITRFVALAPAGVVDVQVAGVDDDGNVTIYPWTVVGPG